MALDRVEVVAAPALVAAESLEQLRDRAFGRLQLVGDGDAVAVVPDRDDERRLQDPDRVQALPKGALARPGVPDRREAHLVAVPRKATRDLAKRRRLAVELRRPGESDGAGHLRADRREIRCRLAGREEILPLAGPVERSGREVTQHLPAGRVRIAHHVRIGVELREVLREVGEPDREHEGLIAVVPRAPITRPKGPRHGELRDLLSLPGDAEGGFADEDLASRQLARRATPNGEPVVGDDLQSGDAKLRVRGGDPGIGTDARLHSPSMVPFRCRAQAATASSARATNGTTAARNSSGRSAIKRCPQCSMMRISAWGNARALSAR